MKGASALAGAVAATALIAGSSVAAGVVVTTQDERGRTITIDAPTRSTEIGEYARILRNSLHGDEIESVTLRVVPEDAVTRLCRSQRAKACYRGGEEATIIVRAGSAAADAYTILHEYGHHVDATIRHRRAPEFNGTPRWWGTRAIGIRLDRDEVSTGYSLGWARSIGEIFAEDYAQLHVRDPYGIGWLPRPDEPVFRAIRLDVTGKAAGPPPRAAGADLSRSDGDGSVVPRRFRGSR
jgi:hypothetical protein